MTSESQLSTHQRQFVRFAQYNNWFNERLYDCVARLDDAERKRDRGAFFGSIHGTLDHILLADRLWLGRFERSSLPVPSLEGAELVYGAVQLDQGVHPEFEALRAGRRATDAVLERFVRELTPELLEQDLDYRNTKGVAFTNPVWLILAHLFNHQTHHRGQTTTLLSQAGVDPGITDFLVATMLPFPSLD